MQRNILKIKKVQYNLHRLCYTLMYEMTKSGGVGYEYGNGHGYATDITCFKKIL